MSLKSIAVLLTLTTSLAISLNTKTTVVKETKDEEEGRDNEMSSMSLVGGMFDVAGFEGGAHSKGMIALKLRTTAVKIHLTKEEQQMTWTPVSDPDSPLRTGKWKPAANGFCFVNQQGEQLHCRVSGGKPSSDSALLIEFACEVHETPEEPRFAAVASTFWQPTPDGHVPYGWRSHWGEFDFRFYAVNEDGFLGCAAVKDGYCWETNVGSAIGAKAGYNPDKNSKPVSLFPFDHFGLKDLLPGSKFYASAQQATVPTQPLPQQTSTDEKPYPEAPIPPDSHDAPITPASSSEPITEEVVFTLSTLTVPLKQEVPEDHAQQTALHEAEKQDAPEVHTTNNDNAQSLSTSSPPFVISSKDVHEHDIEVTSKPEIKLDAHAGAALSTSSPPFIISTNHREGDSFPRAIDDSDNEPTEKAEVAPVKTTDQKERVRQFDADANLLPTSSPPFVIKSLPPKSANKRDQTEDVKVTNTNEDDLVAKAEAAAQKAEQAEKLAQSVTSDLAQTVASLHNAEADQTE